jgi:hypothetical protein
LIGCGLGLVTSILAVIFASKADRNIAAGGGMVTGTGLAKAGRIIGWVGIGLNILGILLLILWIIILIATGTSDSSALGALR